MQGTCFNSFFSVFSVINIEVAKTATNFCLFRILIGIVIFLFADIVVNVTQVFGLVLIFFGNLNSINLNGWMILLATSIMFVFFGDLGLVIADEKL